MGQKFKGLKSQDKKRIWKISKDFNFKKEQLQKNNHPV